MFSVRDIVLTAFILGLLPAVLVRPHWGILLWTWVGLMNPHKMTWGFAYNFPFAMIIGVVTILAILMSREPKRLPLAAPVVILLMLIFWMTITTALFSLFPDLAWPKWEKVLKIQVFILLTLIVMQSEARIRSLVLVATLSIAYFGIKGGIYTIAHGGGGMVLGPDGGFIAGNTEIALALTVTLPLMRWLQLQTEHVWLKRAATVAMILIAVSVLGSQSRGGFLALAAMVTFMWFKSRKKIVLGAVLVALGATLFSLMPDTWHRKMDTIETYEQDRSAMGRIGAWRFATNLALDRPIGGGGFDTFEEKAYDRYAPDERALDPHSIWFQVLAEHGFVGLALFLLLWVFSWRTGTSIIRLCRNRPDLTWARDLAAMIQAALVGFWAGGSFLGLAYWDYPYILVVVLVLTKVVIERQIGEARINLETKSTAKHPSLQTQGR
jgi:probable O-glycosylation ligase, exosortase system type 1-associated